MTTIYRCKFPSRVAKVEERSEIIHASGARDPNSDTVKNVETRSKSLGWWITTDGPSPISFCVGDGKPEGIEAGMAITGSFDIIVPDKTKGATT